MVFGFPVKDLTFAMLWIGMLRWVCALDGFLRGEFWGFCARCLGFEFCGFSGKGGYTCRFLAGWRVDII